MSQSGKVLVAQFTRKRCYLSSVINDLTGNYFPLRPINLTCSIFAGNSEPFEEMTYRHLERYGYVVQPASGYTIRTFLVLLNLLEGNTEYLRKLLLRHLTFQTSLTDSLANVSVDCASGIGFLVRLRSWLSCHFLLLG